MLEVWIMTTLGCRARPLLIGKLATCLVIVLAILAGFDVPEGRAQGFARATPADSVLERLVAEGLKQNPDVQRALADVEAARARVAPSRTWPDPFVSVGYQNEGSRPSLGTSEGSFLAPMLAQTVPWPGKLSLAGRAATQDADAVAAAVLERVKRSVEARVGRSYFAYALARQKLLLIDEREQTWRQVEGVVRERYAAGVAAQQDLFRAQVEILRLEESRAQERATLFTRAAELNRAVGRSQDSPLDSVANLSEEGTVPDLPQILAALRQRSPELAATGAGVRAAELRVRLARREYFPDLVVGGGPMLRGPLEPMWQASLGLTLPIHFRARQGSRVSEARAAERSSRAAEQGVAQELELRTRERLERLRAAARVARLYREGILVTDRNALEAALASYRTGRVPFVTVLEALNVLYGDRFTYLDRLAELAALRVAIDEASLTPEAAMAAGSTTAPGISGPTPESTSSMSSMR